MPHRVKNKHRARHRAHTVKAASLSKPALPLPAAQQSGAVAVETSPQPIGAGANAEAAASE